MKNWFSRYGWLAIFITIFLCGIVFIFWMGNAKLTSGISPSPKLEPMEIDFSDAIDDAKGLLSISPTVSDLRNSPSPQEEEEEEEEEEEDEEEEVEDLEQCPTLLIKRGNKIMLFNKNAPETPGKNPIFFDNLEQYKQYAKLQKELYNQNCPILFLQQETNAQGEDVYRLRKTEGTTTNVDPLLLGSLSDYFKNQTNVVPQFSPPTGPQAFNRVQPNAQLPLVNYGVNPPQGQGNTTEYTDAIRDRPPYNQGFFAFDPTSQYVGRYTVVDQIHDSTKNSGENGLSDNPMDQNWGGAVFTNKQIESGKYKEDEVQPPTVNTALSMGEYPLVIEDSDIETPKINSPYQEQEEEEM
jgi:hypothetical protein